VERSATTEPDVQRRIGSEWWLFGGQYVGVADRRNLAPLDQHDIPLLTANRTVHVVELKGPNVPRLVEQHRNHPIPGAAVHEAVAQAMNYLRTLDEMGPALSTIYQDDLGITYDLRRTFATVVIGHPTHVRTGVDEQVVDRTLRSYNAHLARVEVMTYKQLLDAAERMLLIEQSSRAL